MTTPHGRERGRSGSPPGSSCSTPRSSSPGAATSWPASGRSCPGCPIEQGLPLRDGGRHRLAGGPLRRPLAAAGLPPHVRARVHGRRARSAPRSRTASTARSSTSSTTTSRSPPSRGRRSPPSAPTSAGWGGGSRGRPRSAATSTSTSACRSPRSASATGPLEYNYRPYDPVPAAEAEGNAFVAEIAAMTGTDVATYTREAPGMSAFALQDGVVHHTYSAYARGARRDLGDVPVARPGAAGAQRDRPVVPPSRRVRGGLRAWRRVRVRRRRARTARPACGSAAPARRPAPTRSRSTSRLVGHLRASTVRGVARVRERWMPRCT